jgi:Enoyl-CoA hydratase/carnithine racemase
MDDQTKVVIITGAGGNFCAGQDLKLYFRGTESDPKARARARRAAHTWRWDRLSAFPKPTIAMVHGYCFGGAFTPVVACDFAIAADDATFGLSEVNWGIIPGGLVAWAVTEAMNYRDAIYYAVTGDQFSGKEAAGMKFVNKSVPVEQLTRGDDGAGAQARSQEPGGRPLHQGIDPRRAPHDQGTGLRLSRCQE